MVSKRSTQKEPHFVIAGGVEVSDLCPKKVREYLDGCDWTDKGADGWITPHLRPDDFMKVDNVAIPSEG